MTDLKIPVGISDFAKIRNYDYYYVDKTGLIADLLEKDGQQTKSTCSVPSNFCCRCCTSTMERL